MAWFDRFEFCEDYIQPSICGDKMTLQFDGAVNQHVLIVTQTSNDIEYCAWDFESLSSDSELFVSVTSN